MLKHSITLSFPIIFPYIPYNISIISNNARIFSKIKFRTFELAKMQILPISFRVITNFKLTGIEGLSAN